MTSTRHTYRAFLISDPDDVEMPVRGGTITLDAGTAPHVTASIDVSAPGVWEFTLVGYPDAAGFGYGEGPYGGGGYGGWYTEGEWVPDEIALAALDPRLDARVRIEWTMQDAFGATTERHFDLGLRERPIQHRDAVITLNLASDEALLQDWAPLTDDTTALSWAASLRDVVDYVLTYIGASLESSPSIDFDLSTDAEDDALTWRAGQNGLDFLQPLVQVAGFRLVCNESREWTLRDEDYTADGTTSIRHAVNLTDADELISRDSGIWFDAAVARYTWTDGSGLEHVETDTYSLDWPYTRLQLFEFDKAYPGPGFAEYAVRRAQQRGREIEASAVSDPTVTAEQSVTIYLDDTPTQTGRSQAITFDLTEDEMTVTARTIDTESGVIDLLVGTIDSLVGTIDSL